MPGGGDGGVAAGGIAVLPLRAHTRPALGRVGRVGRRAGHLTPPRTSSAEPSAILAVHVLLYCVHDRVTITVHDVSRVTVHNESCVTLYTSHDVSRVTDLLYTMCHVLLYTAVQL